MTLLHKQASEELRRRVADVADKWRMLIMQSDFSVLHSDAFLLRVKKASSYFSEQLELILAAPLAKTAEVKTNNKQAMNRMANTLADLRQAWLSKRYLLMKIAEEVVELKYVPCTACNYCMPCPYGINIPGVFTHYNKCLNEDKMPAGNPDSDEYRKARRAFLVGYDRSVPKLRQASHCIACKQCVEHCPQRVDIPAEMYRIDVFVEHLKRMG